MWPASRKRNHACPARSARYVIVYTRSPPAVTASGPNTTFPASARTDGVACTKPTSGGKSTSSRTFRASSPPVLRTRTVSVTLRPFASAAWSGDCSHTSAAVPWNTVVSSCASRVLRASVAVAVTTRWPLVASFSP